MSQPSQAEIFAALQAQSSGSFKRNQPKTFTYDSFLQQQQEEDSSIKPIDQLVNKSESLKGDQRLNNRRIYCPRDGCGSLILMDGVGDLIQIEEGSILPDDPASPFSQSSKPYSYWYISSGPFAFENIGFSRPDKTNLNPLPTYTPNDINDKTQGKVKYLICAECDLGPLGWSFDGGKAAWLDCKRVRYGEEKK
ncbi:uncharacterized protein L201_005119 [Kwoniella dendrophila CBS 6074]|uniref:Mss4-like protein n=1 Tax=Kwoniella dendrophila CBS 6074 TaxID=1295534 RepID=A0AAX4JY98_9TREE